MEEHALALALVVAHGSLDLFGGGDVQLRVIGIARELHIAAILHGEGLQRDHLQGIFHLTAGEGITAFQVDAIRVVFHSEFATTNQIDIVGLVGIQVAHDTGSLGDVDPQVGLKASGCGADNDRLGGVAEIGKLHQLIQSVICRQR